MAVCTINIRVQLTIQMYPRCLETIDLDKLMPIYKATKVKGFFAIKNCFSSNQKQHFRLTGPIKIQHVLVESK